MPVAPSVADRTTDMIGDARKISSAATMSCLAQCRMLTIFFDVSQHLSDTDA